MSDCIAHWYRIPSPPAEPIGICRRCGTSKAFSNLEPDTSTVVHLAGDHAPFYRTPINNVDAALRGGR